MTIPRRLMLLRWMFLTGLALVVLGTPALLDIALPVVPLLITLGLLGLFNIVNVWRSAGESRPPVALAAQLCVDLTGLGVLLYLAGGAANPLVSMLLFPVVVAALTLPGYWVVAVTLLAVTIYSGLMVFFVPLAISDIERASRLHLVGMWLTFVVSAVLAAWFVTRMTASIRARDAALADAREQALRDAQVVAMGQLAAGAAHELGTPLATMHVLAGELSGDARLPVDLRADVDLIRTQILACKEIISGLTSQAGVGRAGAMQRIPASEWLASLLARWRALWPQANCILKIESQGDSPEIVSNVALEQALVNLLNNAARVAPSDLILALSWDSHQLYFAVHDHGPGFSPDVLRCSGAEPLPASEDGNGVGLWLTRTAVERAGGHLNLQNTHTGAIATLSLPYPS